MQDALARGVINPQDGHIVCERKSRGRVVTIVNSFRKESTAEITPLRSLSRNGRRYDSIVSPSFFCERRLFRRQVYHDSLEGVHSVQDCSQCPKSIFLGIAVAVARYACGTCGSEQFRPA
jgi:ribosomal protein S27AE